MWPTWIQYLLAFSCLNSFRSCQASHQCAPYTDLAGKVGVNCSHRSLESVPTSLTSDTEVLLLGFNSIESVSLSSFKNLSKLHDLDLSHNRIKHLEADSPLLVEKVDLSSNSLAALPDFSKLPNLRKLIVDHNQIDVLPEGVFDPLGKLEEFSIKGNNIDNIPAHIFDPLENLRYLTLSANKIQEFPSGSLDRMKSLETLDISNNKLRTIPQDLFEENLLLYVFLYNNPWDCECSSAKYLKEWVDDNDGNIYKVLGEPDTESVVCETPAVWRGTPVIKVTLEQMCPIATTEIWLSTVRGFSTTLRSPLLQTSPPQEVCSRYTDLAGKVGVNCSHRSLESVPPSLTSDTEVLLLGFNSIQSVDLSSFKNLSKLHDLDLSHNRIKHLEADSPLLVEMVDLSSNALAALPDFSKLPNLRKLIVDHNQIDVLPEGVFDPLGKLKEFSIKGNNIDNIPAHIFDPLENLRYLTLSANKIQEFPSGSLDRMKSLETLDISNNKLRTIPQDLFEDNLLLYVFLYNNPWDCECSSAKYLKEWVDDNDGNIYKVLGEPDTESVVCETPAVWRGTPVIKVTLEQMCPIATTEIWLSTVRGFSTTLRSPLLQTSPPQEVCSRYTDLAGKVGVNCSHRSLESVPPSLTSDTEVLLLGFNSIQSVDLSSFKNLSKLHDLDLSHNRIKHLEADSPLLVEKVDLSSNALAALPDFSKLPNLRKLIVDHNQIDVLPEGVFDPLGKLEEFSLEGNNIDNIPAHLFDPLENLRYLTLSANKIQEFPSGSLDRMKSLETLDISNNKLRTIPQDLFENNRLHYVFLYNNSWDCECSSAKYLKEWVDDNDGNIYKVLGEPDTESVVCETPAVWRGTPVINVTLEQMCPIATTETTVWLSTVRGFSTTLRSPLLQTSPPQEVCSPYTDLAGKVGVNCSHRSLESVPSSLTSDTEVLLLGFNSIESVDLSSFKNLSKLHDLDLSHNRIKHLEADSPLLVEMVDLSSNALTALPDFSKLPNLRKLIVDHNQIDVLPEGLFDPLGKLEEFSIKGNNIDNIPAHIFDPLENLRYLTLSANKIQEFPSGLLHNLINLTALDISGNSLCTIPPDFFQNNSLLCVFLYNNPWCCDCDIQYLFEWIRTNEGKLCSTDGTFDGSAASCRAPPELRGVPLIHVSIQNRCIGTLPPSPSVPATTPLSLSPTPSVTDPDGSFSASARRSGLLGLLRRLGCSCCLLFLLYLLSLLLSLLEVTALAVCALRFRRRLYLPLKRLSQRRPNIRLVRYSLALPNYRLIYPPPSPDASMENMGEVRLEEDGYSGKPIEEEGDALTSFL